MPSYKDQTTGKWFCKFYYADHTGNRKQKLKRGFDLKRDADQWERDFLEKMQGTPEMSFETLSKLYLDHIQLNRKEITYKCKESRVRVWLVPYFKDMQINKIAPLDVKNWQDHLKKSQTVHGNPLSSGYIGTLHRELSNMFNYAVKYYGLKKNPCPVVGNVKKNRNRSLNFWTLDQFNEFINTFDQSDPFRLAFLVLYWTGMRVGELQALTIGDFDADSQTITINKTYHLIHGQDVITEPKTSAGNREIKINASLVKELQHHISRLYEPDNTTRLFSMTPSAYGKQLAEHAKTANLPKIRVHDLRHSHASLLIELGFSPTLIASRLGHEKVSVTLDIYGHLYPNKQDELADKLESIIRKYERMRHLRGD